MAHPGFAHLWQQQELSDVDIVVIAGAPCAEDSAPAGDSMLTEGQPLVLQQFPGHSSILSISQYCKAQVTHCVHCSVAQHQILLIHTPGSCGTAAVLPVGVILRNGQCPVESNPSAGFAAPVAQVTVTI
jgi:hypothetical protein